MLNIISKTLKVTDTKRALEIILERGFVSSDEIYVFPKLSVRGVLAVACVEDSGIKLTNRDRRIYFDDIGFVEVNNYHGHIEKVIRERGLVKDVSYEYEFID